MDRRYHDCKPSRHSVAQSFHFRTAQNEAPSGYRICRRHRRAPTDRTARGLVKRLQLDSSATLQVTSRYSGSATPVPDSLTTMVYGQKPFLMN
jgi:hypothetical protein